MLRGAAGLAPELKEMEQERENRRYERLEDSVASLEQFLPKDLTISKARDLMWAFTGRDLYRLLVVERKWSSDEYETWLADQLIKTLIG